MQDVHLLEKLAHFDRERIPERVVHAKGAGDLYRKAMTDMDRDHLIGTIVDNLGKAQGGIQLRQAALFFKADPDYGRRVAQGLDLDIEQVKHLAGVSSEHRADETGR